MISAGDAVRLKRTTQEYTVLELYDHFVGLKDGEKEFEAWAKLKTHDGQVAHWKVQQLEKIGG